MYYRAQVLALEEVAAFCSVSGALEAIRSSTGTSDPVRMDFVRFAVRVARGQLEGAAPI